MTAVMFYGASSSLSLYLLLFFLVVVTMIFAPQPMRTDKRTIVGLGLLVLAVVGKPLYAVVCNVCAVCKTSNWWLFPECWFL